MGSSPHLWLCAFKTASLTYVLLVSIGPSPHLWFSYAKQRLVEQHTSLYGYQTSPVVLCIQTSLISIRITSLYGSQHSSVVFACKTAAFGPELQVSVCTRPHLSFCACKLAWLAPELLVSMCSSPHLWFLQAKQRVLYTNNESLWVPDLTCHFVLAKQRD